jgi:hypothetical protein
MTTKEILQDAIGTGELLHIIYYGGSQPGTTRMIFPRKIDGNKVLAKCSSNENVIHFFIDKIELTGEPDGEITYIKRKKTVEPKNIKDALKQHVKNLKQLGWHVELEINSIGLYSQFKNGKLRKTPDISCEFRKYIIDYGIVDDDGNLNEEERLSSMPYHVHSSLTGNDDRHFKYLSKAVDLFLDYAKEKNM